MQSLKILSRKAQIVNSLRGFHLVRSKLRINRAKRGDALPVATNLFNKLLISEVNGLKNEKYFSSVAEEVLVDSVTFEKVCEETLESLTEYFEELVENDPSLKDADISYSSGVLTVNLGHHGTYVINRQSPNKQIWLSSPVSGPKRYDLIPEGEYWIYKHTGEILHKLLQDEIGKIVGKDKVDFARCSHSQ